MYIRGMPKGIEGVGAKTKISPHTMPLSNFLGPISEMLLEGGLDGVKFGVSVNSIQPDAAGYAHLCLPPSPHLKT